MWARGTQGAAGAGRAPRLAACWLTSAGARRTNAFPHPGERGARASPTPTAPTRCHPDLLPFLNLPAPFSASSTVVLSSRKVDSIGHPGVEEKRRPADHGALVLRWSDVRRRSFLKLFNVDAAVRAAAPHAGQRAPRFHVSSQPFGVSESDAPSDRLLLL